MEQRISLVTLGVRDLAASRAFYRRLGWTETDPDQEGVAFFRMGSMVFGLFGRDDLAEDARIDAAGTGTGQASLAINMRSKEEVDAALKEAESVGAKILKPAEDVFWGGYSGYFADPDGHLWEIAFNPFWIIADDGSVSPPG